MLVGGVFFSVSRLVRALGHGLVGSAKERPSKPELPLRFGAAHRPDYSPDLRHRRRDQLGIRTRAEIPFLAAPSSCSATERTTTR